MCSSTQITYSPHGDVLFKAGAEGSTGHLPDHLPLWRGDLTVLPGWCAAADEANTTDGDALSQLLLDHLRQTTHHGMHSPSQPGSHYWQVGLLEECVTELSSRHPQRVMSFCFSVVTQFAVLSLQGRSIESCVW